MPSTFLSGEQYLWLVAILTLGVVIALALFFWALAKQPQEARFLLTGGAFLQSLTVLLVVLGTGCLALVGKLSPEVAGTLLSGIVGYVLGNVRRNASSRGRGSEEADDGSGLRKPGVA